MIRRVDFAGDLTDAEASAAAMTKVGLSEVACGEKARLLAIAAESLVQRHLEPSLALFVPGRIEVLGKHTDYAGGSSIVAAAERGFCVAAGLRDDLRMTAIDALAGESIGFELDAELTPQAGHWANYPMTVARRIARNFPGDLRGLDIAFASDLPPAAGMSSSSAMMVGLYLALEAANRLSERPEFRASIAGLTDLAGYLGTVENGQSFGSLVGDRGVGTFGGSEDHTAILTARPGQLSQYAYCPVRFERAVPLPDGWVFAVGTSGVAAEKTGAAMARYNAASRSAAALAELWRSRTGRQEAHLAAVLASGEGAKDRLAEIAASGPAEDFPPESLARRLAHFVAENEEILPAAAEALAGGDLDEFGRLVDRSQAAAEKLLGNQVPETIYLAASARRSGATAASAFGAGFGGSVWALVEASSAADFLADWSHAYWDRFPNRRPASTFFLTAAGPAAFRVQTAAAP